MKKRIKIIPLLLSVVIFIASFFQFTLISYASSSGIHTDKNKAILNKFFEDTKWGLSYVICQLGAFASGDFFSLMQNKATFNDYWNTENITISEDGESIVFSDELVNYIKQALREYAEETCGFVIIPSIHIDSVSPSYFNNGYEYQTLKALAKENGLVAYRSSNGGTYGYSIQYIDLSSYVDGSSGFYYTSNTEYSNRYGAKLMGFNTWTNTNVKYSIIYTTDWKSNLNSWDEIKELCDLDTTKSSYKTNYTIDTTVDFMKPGYTINSRTSFFVVSNDGRNVLLFKSKEALQNYSVDHRSIYFGSKFYEDTGEITAAFEDLQNYLDGKYDDFLEKLKDMIGGSNLSEDDLEKLVDKLLDQLKDVEGSIGDVDNSLKETNSLLEQILQALQSLDNTVASALSGLEFSFDTSGIESYLEAILEQLGIISFQMEDMTTEQFKEKTNSFLDDIISLFMEVGALLKTKFPFSIPWDLSNMVSYLADTDFDNPSTYNTLSSDNGIMPFAHVEIEQPEESSYAPRFKIPFMLSESLGLEGVLVIDLSYFEFLSQLSRSLSICLWGVCIFNLTFKILGDIGGDLFD